MIDTAARLEDRREEAPLAQLGDLEDGWEVHDNVTGVERVAGIPLHYWPQGVRMDG